MNPETSKVQLTEYITQMRSVGKSDADIKTELLNAGWVAVDIDAALLPQQNIAPTNSASTPVTTQYAGFWHRVAAAVLDGVILSLVFAVLMVCSAVVTTSGAVSGGMFSVLMTVVQFVVWFFYYIYAESRTGQTLGKKFVGVTVSNYEGGRISLLRSTGRSFAKILSIIPLGIGLLMVAFTGKKQALHDIIASTIVTKNERANKYRSALVIVLGTFGPIIFFVFIVPVIMAAIFASLFLGTADVQVLDQSEVMEESVLGESALREAYDGYFNEATVWDLDVVTKEDMEEFGYTEAGPVVLSWDPRDASVLSVMLPVFSDDNLGEYASVVYEEVLLSSGKNVLDPSVNSIPFNMTSTFNDIHGGRVYISANEEEDVSDIVKITGKIIFEAPLEDGTVYEKTFDFALEK